MARLQDSVRVRATRRFDASAAHVYDAFLDPSRAGTFLFATPTGRIVRCEIDARVGGTFTIVDRRGEEDVVHSGKYVALERPRRIVFTLSVEKYSSGEDTVTIDIAPLAKGCELTLTHEIETKDAQAPERAQEGWAAILDVAAELLVDDTPTCGIGLAGHATIPARIAGMFEGLAETLELHRRMLVADDPNARKEDEVYRDLCGTLEADRGAGRAGRCADGRAARAADGRPRSNSVGRCAPARVREVREGSNAGAGAPARGRRTR